MTAAGDFETATVIFQAGKNYHHACFFCHLVIEKNIKALVVRETRQTAPYSHDLIYLSERANLKLDEDEKSFFELLNRFVIEARYPDEKLKLYKLATRELAETCLTKTEKYQTKLQALAKQ